MLPEADDKSDSPLLNAEVPEDTQRAFDRFRTEVTQKPELFEQLQGAANNREFINRVVELGAVRGFIFSQDEVESALRDARRRWIERNVA